MSGEGGGEEEKMEPFTMITTEDVAGASAGLMGSLSSGKAWIQVERGARGGREGGREETELI